MNCPLCHDDNPILFSSTISTHTKNKEDFFQCSNCSLVYKDSLHWLTKEEEKLRYDEHNNDPEDSRYREYLSRAIDPLIHYLKTGDIGLDFGSGPGPTISLILKELGYQVFNYDPFYANEVELLKQKYHFVTSTEVFEHLNTPHRELKIIKDILRPSGYLCLMTQLYSEDIDFKKWWYKNDPTHIVFYMKETIEWIAKHYCFSLKYIENNIIILKNEN